MAIAKVKASIKELSPKGESLRAGMVTKFYNDNGSMFSPTITQRCRRVTIDDEAFWLVKIPTR